MFQLPDLLVLDLDQVQKHLVLVRVVKDTIVEVDAIQLLLLKLNNLGCVSLLHLNLGLSERLILIVILHVLVLQEGNSLVLSLCRVLSCLAG